MTGKTRREFMQTMAIGAAAVAATEMGGLGSALAEDKFTFASTGGSWGEGLKVAFIDKPGFEKKHNLQVAYSHQLESVATSKIVASCGNPPFTASSNNVPDSTLMADSGCLQAYDLNAVPNYKDIIPAIKVAPRAGMEAWFGPYIITVFGVGWNTKEASKPATMRDLWASKYKGKVGVPAYGWYGMVWLHSVAKEFGGGEDNIAPGIQAVAELVKKNQAVMIENVDDGMKKFTRGEIAIAPFWNGRIFALQESNVPVDIAYVPNSVVVTNAVVITKGSAFAKQAQDLVNNSLDPGFQLEMTTRFRYPPASRKAKLEGKQERYQVPEAALEKTAKIDWPKVNKHRDAYLERWNKEVLG